LSIYKIYNAPGVAGSWVSAIQGPGVQFHAPKTDVYFVLETSLCCHSVQLSHDELSVRISAAGRGLAAQMDLLRASAVTQLSPTPLTSPRSRSSRSVTAYKPTSHSAQHKRSTAVRNPPSQPVYQPKLSPAYRPSPLSQLAPLAPGLQLLPLSVYTLPTTSMSSPCMSWHSGHIS
jgi:hypothetical protein